MDKITLLKELFLRLKSDSPEFFKKIKKYSIYLVTIIGITLGLEWLEAYTLPGKLSSVLWAILTYFLGTASTATLPAKEPEKLTDSKYKI